MFSGSVTDEVHLDRLVQIKRRYDPENVFHLNQNINPTRLRSPVSSNDVSWLGLVLVHPGLAR
jgi:hypothetical protein